MLVDTEDDIPVVVNTTRALTIVHVVTMSDDATDDDKDKANSLLSALIPELRYPTTALRPSMRQTYNELRDKYG